jgi:hypothetical protein
MPRMRPQIFKSLMLLAVVSILTAACAIDPTRETNTQKILEKANEKVIKKSSNQKVFQYSYDSVWRAAQLSLKYPISLNNMDNGVIETEWIKAIDGFLSPISTQDPSSGVRYKITMNLVKGKLDGNESVRVTIYKKIEKQRDFFSEPETLPSDGLEEMTLFYRMEREVLVDEGIKKAAAGSNN